MLFIKCLCSTKTLFTLILMVFLITLPSTPSIAHDGIPHLFSTTTTGVTNLTLTVTDIWNNGDASDLEIIFDPPLNIEIETEYRLVVVKADQATDFDLNAAANVPTDRYTTVEPSAFSTFQLPAAATDTDGDPITEEVSYVAYAFIIGESESTLATSPEITLHNETIVRTLVPELESGIGGIGVDSDGNVYAGNSVAGTIDDPNVFRVTPAGEVSIYSTESPGGSGYAFDAEGTLYQANFGLNSVSLITPDGEVAEFAAGGMRSPVGIAISEDNALYIASCGNGSIYTISPDGQVERFALSALLACPNGVAFDEDGNLYASNWSNGNIIKLTPDGEASVLVEVPGRNNGHLVYAGDGLFYIIARTANQIYAVTVDGEIELVAGSGERGHDDGPALAATFSLPNDIKISPDGRVLYLNELSAVSGTLRFPVVIRMIVLVR